MTTVTIYLTTQEFVNLQGNLRVTGVPFSPCGEHHIAVHVEIHRITGIWIDYGIIRCNIEHEKCMD